MVDKDVSKQAAREFKKQGLDIRLGTMVKSADVKDGQVMVTVEDKNGETQFSFDKLLVSVGRKPYTEGLLADDSGVQLTENGQIQVDDQSRTTAAGVWSIGDCVRQHGAAHAVTDGPDTGCGGP